MPPLKQPKELSYLCYSTFSIHCAKIIRHPLAADQSVDPIRRFLSDLPTSILEILGSWIVQSAAGLVHCLASDHADKDDKVCRVPHWHRILAFGPKLIDIGWALQLALVTKSMNFPWQCSSVGWASFKMFRKFGATLLMWVWFRERPSFLELKCRGTGVRNDWPWKKNT